MPNINSSSLALRRKRLGYERKQIAFLLGHKTTHQLCRYETGQRTPSFKEAVKLSLLYKLPLRSLFDRYFRHCFQELENTIKHSGLPVKINLENNQSDADYRSYQELLNSPRISESDADKIRRHIKILLRQMPESLYCRKTKRRGLLSLSHQKMHSWNYQGRTA